MSNHSDDEIMEAPTGPVHPAPNAAMPQATQQQGQGRPLAIRTRDQQQICCHGVPITQCMQCHMLVTGTHGPVPHPQHFQAQPQAPQAQAQPQILQPQPQFQPRALAQQLLIQRLHTDLSQPSVQARYQHPQPAPAPAPTSAPAPAPASHSTVDFAAIRARFTALVSSAQGLSSALERETHEAQIRQYGAYVAGWVECLRRVGPAQMTAQQVAEFEVLREYLNYVMRGGALWIEEGQGGQGEQGGPAGAPGDDGYGGEFGGHDGGDQYGGGFGGYGHGPM